MQIQEWRHGDNIRPVQAPQPHWFIYWLGLTERTLFSCILKNFFALLSSTTLPSVPPRYGQRAAGSGGCLAGSPVLPLRATAGHVSRQLVFKLKKKKKIIMHDTPRQTIQKPCSNAVQHFWVTVGGTHVFISQHAACIISRAAVPHFSSSGFALPGLELKSRLAGKFPPDSDVIFRQPQTEASKQKQSGKRPPLKTLLLN